MILVPVLPVLEARYVLMDLASAPAAKRNATVPASALPNVAADVHLLTTVITEPAPVLINPVEKYKSVPLPIPAAVVSHAPAPRENFWLIFAYSSVVREAGVKNIRGGGLYTTPAVL